MIQIEWQVTHRLTFRTKEVTTWRLPMQHNATYGTEMRSRLRELVSPRRAPLCNLVGSGPPALQAAQCGHGPGQGAQQGLRNSGHGAAGQPASSWKLILQNAFLQLCCFLTLPAENRNHHVRTGWGVSDNQGNRLPVIACANAACLFSILLFSVMLMSDEKYYTEVVWSTLNYYHTVCGQNTEVSPC